MGELRAWNFLSPSVVRCLALPPSFFIMARLPLVELGINSSELIRAMTVLSGAGITASQAAARLEEAMARLNELPIHHNVETTQTVCPVCEEEERMATRCPATELLNISESGTPRRPNSIVPETRLIRED